MRQNLWRRKEVKRPHYTCEILFLWCLTNCIVSSDAFILIEFIKFTTTEFRVVCFELLDFLSNLILN